MIAGRLKDALMYNSRMREVCTFLSVSPIFTLTNIVIKMICCKILGIKNGLFSFVIGICGGGLPLPLRRRGVPCGNRINILPCNLLQSISSPYRREVERYRASLSKERSMMLYFCLQPFDYKCVITNDKE